MLKPNRTIRIKTGDYLYRWHLIPRNKWFNIYLHKTVLDDYRILHDHPWDNISIVLWGGYYEQTVIKDDGLGFVYSKDKYLTWHGPGSILVRRNKKAHRLQLKDFKPCWSLFITGPRKSDWGFHTNVGWMSHTYMLDMDDYGQGLSIFRDEVLDLLK